MSRCSSAAAAETWSTTNSAFARSSSKPTRDGRASRGCVSWRTGTRATPRVSLAPSAEGAITYSRPGTRSRYRSPAADQPGHTSCPTSRHTLGAMTRSVPRAPAGTRRGRLTRNSSERWGSANRRCKFIARTSAECGLATRCLPRCGVRVAPGKRLNTRTTIPGVLGAAHADHRCSGLTSLR